MRYRTLKKYLVSLWKYYLRHQYFGFICKSYKLLSIWRVKMEWVLSLDQLFIVHCVLNIAVSKYHTARNPIENGKPSTCLFGQDTMLLLQELWAHCKGSHIPAHPTPFFTSTLHRMHTNIQRILTKEKVLLLLQDQLAVCVHQSCSQGALKACIIKLRPLWNKKSCLTQQLECMLNDSSYWYLITQVIISTH